MNSNSNCAYHSDRIAVTTCERCSRLICVNDKRKYRKITHTGSGSHRRSHSTTYEYCPVCFSEQQINDATGPAAVGGNIALIVFGLFWIGVSSNVSPPFVLVGFGVIGYAVYNLATGPDKANKARLDQDNFLKNLSSKPSGIQIARKSKKYKPQLKGLKWSTNNITCFECGNSIAISDDYCMNCGDSTVDERAALATIDR